MLTICQPYIKIKIFFLNIFMHTLFTISDMKQNNVEKSNLEESQIRIL